MRVVRYLNTTQDKSLRFEPVIDRGNEIKLFVDASYNYDTDTRRSRSGYIATFNGCPIMWRSRMQPIITLSSTEAEYVALCEAAKEAVWLRRVLTELGFKQGPITIYVDNKGAIELATQRKTNMRTKHIDIRYHWIREKVEQGIIRLVHVASAHNIADLLTKIVGAVKARQLLEHIMD